MEARSNRRSGLRMGSIAPSPILDRRHDLAVARNLLVRDMGPEQGNKAGLADSRFTQASESLLSWGATKDLVR